MVPARADTCLVDPPGISREVTPPTPAPFSYSHALLDSQAKTQSWGIQLLPEHGILRVKQGPSAFLQLGGLKSPPVSSTT